jgi:hypothetical protein
MSEPIYEQPGFDPGRYIRKVNGSDYLEVKWRLVWLRAIHPDATIDTDIVSFNETHALFKATITVPDGGSATGYGSESPGDFRDYIEKAETKAIGRALAALGYGTQFAGDYEDGAQAGRPVDAPVNRGGGGGSDSLATERQVGLIRALQSELQIENVEMVRLSLGKRSDELTKAEASALIEKLNARKGQAR